MYSVGSSSWSSRLSSQASTNRSGREQRISSPAGPGTRRATSSTASSRTSLTEIPPPGIADRPAMSESLRQHGSKPGAQDRGAEQQGQGPQDQDGETQGAAALGDRDPPLRQAVDTAVDAL